MVKPVRRIVAGVGDEGKAQVLSDGPSPDVRLDPAWLWRDPLVGHGLVAGESEGPSRDP